MDEFLMYVLVRNSK